MTENEARGYIKGKLDCMNECGVFNREDSENTDLCDNCHYCYSQGNFGQQKEAFSMAIKALGKQIPKKPTYDGDGYAPDGTFVWDEWLCPCCRSRYEIDYDEYDFCPNCGQAIDWSDEE